MFSKDANELVLAPIEKMITKVKAMAENPLKKVAIDDSEDSSSMETKILENTFIKICGLMAVGYGEAGAEIIADNLKNSASSYPAPRCAAPGATKPAPPPSVRGRDPRERRSCGRRRREDKAP